jgi:hypothetical protein
MNDDKNNKESRITWTVVFLILIGCGAYGLATENFGWSVVILGGTGLAYIAITGKT